jgi:hypothetical protein
MIVTINKIQYLSFTVKEKVLAESVANKMNAMGWLRICIFKTPCYNWLIEGWSE